MHHLLTVRELGLKEALEQQRQKNLAQMEDKLQEFNWKVATWTETLSQVRAGLEHKDHVSFLKVRGAELEPRGWGWQGPGRCCGESRSWRYLSLSQTHWA